MSRIELNHWFINGNELSISLMNFAVSIQVSIDNNSIIYILSVFSDNRAITMLRFNSLEDAINFTENVINKCENLDQILEEYDKRIMTRVLKSKLTNKL